MTLRDRLSRLEAAQERLRPALEKVQREATLRAVDAATDATPPVMDDLSGTNTRSGKLKQGWAADSVTKPRWDGSRLVTELNNTREYASYVDQGHDLKRHFVPGLYINERSGLLEYDPQYKGGIVVGTKTAYVPGKHMVDKARQVYREVLESTLNDALEQLFR